MDELIRIGRIIKPHGLRGEMKVIPLTGDKKRFELLESVKLRGADYKIESIKYQTKYIILKFRGIDSIETAETYRNEYIEIERIESYQPDEGKYFYYQLEGLKVKTVEGRLLGEIVEIMQLPANDVYVVHNAEGGEILLPAVDDVVKKIDIENGVMLVELLKGLF